MNQYSAWYYDEFKQVGENYTDSEQVNSYDLNMQNLRDIAKESGHICELLGINESSSVLEIGTGTGELALNLSGCCKKVVAIDISNKMINFAKTKAQKQNKRNIQFFNAGFLTYENEGELFDIIITQLALHHLPDYWKLVALKRIYGMLEADGKFYLRDVVFPSNVQDYDIYFGNIITGLKESTGNKIAEETEIHIREEFSALDWIMEGLLKNAGFHIEDLEYDGFIANYLCMNKLFKSSINC